MNEQINEFFNWLDKAKEAVLSEVAVLASDGRTDESNSLKAKANVYDICKSVTGAILKKAPDMSFNDAFAPFERITAPWRESLEAAKAHDDARKVMVEEAKLSAVTEILAKIKEMF